MVDLGDAGSLSKVQMMYMSHYYNDNKPSIYVKCTQKEKCTPVNNRLENELMYLYVAFQLIR